MQVEALPRNKDTMKLDDLGTNCPMFESYPSGCVVLKKSDLTECCVRNVRKRRRKGRRGGEGVASNKLVSHSAEAAKRIQVASCFRS